MPPSAIVGLLGRGQHPIHMRGLHGCRPRCYAPANLGCIGRRLVMRTHARSPSSIGRLERFTDGPKVLGMLRQRVVHAGTGRRGTPNNAHNCARTAAPLARRHGDRVFLGAGPTVADGANRAHRWCVAMRADAGTQLLHLRHKVVSCELCKIFIYSLSLLCATTW